MTYAREASSAQQSNKGWQAQVKTFTGRRVLVLNPGADVYGSDLQMLESVTALREAGAEVTVACASSGPLLAMITARDAKAEVLTYPVVRRSYLSPQGILRLVLELGRDAPGMVRLVRRTRPDVAYVNTTTIPWWILLCRVLGVRVLCHVHEAEDQDRAWVLKALNVPLLLAHQLILISATAADSVWRIYPSLRRRSVVVMNGVPDRDAEPVAPPAALPTRLAVVGRLSPRKAPHTAIEAAAELATRGVEVSLEVAGTPFPGYEWYETELRELAAARGIGEKVEFTGYVTPSSLAFDRSDIVLAPSVREPFGNAVVEAQLAQRPVVAASAGGHRESITDGVTGVLVPPEDPRAMADAVEALLADPTAATEMGQAARTSALRKFGVRRYREELAQTVLG
jgi:glycosyltransferase involved in cell wall biosynthesis